MLRSIKEAKEYTFKLVRNVEALKCDYGSLNIMNNYMIYECVKDDIIFC